MSTLRGAETWMQELQEKNRLEVLLDIHHATLTTQNLPAIAQLTLEHIHKLAPTCVASSVVLLDLPGDQAHVLAINPPQLNQAPPMERTLSLADLAVDLAVLEEGRPYWVVNLNDLPNLLPLQVQMLARGIQSYLALPLCAFGQLLGSLNLAAQKPDGFSDAQIDMFHEVAEALALAVHQSRLLEAEKQGRREAELMRDVMAALASSVDLNQVLGVILRNLGGVVHYDRAALYIQNENSEFQLPAITRKKTGQLPNIFPPDDPIIMELRNARRPLVVIDIQNDIRFAAWPEHELVRGWMGVPLYTGEDMIGIISLGDLEPGAYRPADADLVQMFASQVADVLYRARLQEKSSRRAEELELLTSFSFALRQAEGQEHVLAALMDQATRIFGANRGVFLLLEKDAASLVVSFSQDPTLVGKWHTHGTDPLWQVVRTNRPHFITEIQNIAEQHSAPIYQALFRDMSSAALLPLNSGEKVLGVLCFTFDRVQDFSDEDRRLFNAISEIAGTALSRAAVLENLEKQVNTRTRHLSTLYEISSVAGEPDEVEVLMQRMLEITLEVMNSPAGAIHRLDETASHLSLLAEVNIPAETRAAFSNLPVSVDFWRSLVESSEPLVIPDLKTDTRIPQRLADCPFPALLAAPIRAKGRCLGLFSIFNSSILDYTIEDITLFTTIAEQIAGAVERARLQHQAERAAVAEERQRLARELHDSISQLLYSLVLYAGAGRKVLRQGDLDNTAEYLRRIDQTSLQALKEMRLMVYELRPSVFHEEGLVGALNRRLQAVEKRTGMNAQLLVDGEISLDEAVELALYRITEEALNNTLKHAEATQVLVRIASHTGRINLEIKDNGKGFRLEDARAAGGLGLVGIQERVNHLGGKLEIASAPGQGTRIFVSLEGFE